MIVRIRGGRGSRTEGRDRKREGEGAEDKELDRGGESQRECVYLSFSSPDSDREQTTEDNEKQIFGGEEGEGGG